MISKLKKIFLSASIICMYLSSVLFAHISTSKDCNVEKGMKKTILVTGGAGFLGSHLCEELLLRGHKVICLDNCSTGSREKIEHLEGNEKFLFVEHDVVFPIDLKVDQIFNLACPASPIHYQADPVKTTKTSVLGAINVLELARKNGARVLQASTSEVYGDPVAHPQREEHWGHVNPIGMRSCYDEGKRCAESLFFDYNRQHGVDIRVVRIFNTFGPKMCPQDGRVVSNFIVQALSGQPITIYGDGSQTRSFCYVDDLVQGLCSAMEGKHKGPINLGNPEEKTILEIAEMIKEMTSSPSKIILKDLPPDDPKLRKPDISCARDHLGWEPIISLNEGLIKTIAYFSGLVSKL